MRLKFSKPRFGGDRTFQPGEVAEVEDELAAQMIKEGVADQTDEDLTVFKAAADATDQDAPKDPPKDPPKPKK